MGPYDVSDTSLTETLKKTRVLKMVSPQLRATGVYLVILPFVMRETRSTIVLIKIAKKLRKTTGDNRYRARVEDELPSLANLIFIACTRPVRKLKISVRCHLIARTKNTQVSC